MKLYDLAKNFVELQTRLEAAENEDSKEIIATTLESVEFDLEEKTEGILKIVKNYEGDIDAIDNEIKRLKSLKENKQNHIENLKKYLLDNLVSIGKTKVETPLFKVFVKRTPPSVHITDEHTVPANYMKITYSVDKTELKKALLNEETAAELNELGISLVQSDSLMIK